MRRPKKERKKFKYSPNVKKLSATSFFTDLASEMLYPIMPLLWASLGFSAQAIGLIEGIAEAVAGMSKLLWGYISDRFSKYKSLVVLGYGISAVMKPFYGITTTYVVPLIARNIERFGKAIRTAPRDAILAAESAPGDRPRIIGFHRSIDTLGAVVGPILCLGLLAIFDENLRAIFLIAFIPGALAVLAALLVDEKNVKKIAAVKAQPIKLGIATKELKNRVSYKKLVVGLAIFALINSSDVYLILRLRDLGISSTMIVFAYILYNSLYATAAKTTHRIVKAIGMRGSILVCLVLFALSYGLLSLDLTLVPIILTLLVYGIFAGLFEVVSKSWTANLLPDNLRATGVGLAGSVTSVCFLLAAIITGWLWAELGSANTLAILAMLTIVPFIYFSTVTIKGEDHAKN